MKTYLMDVARVIVVKDSCQMFNMHTGTHGTDKKKNKAAACKYVENHCKALTLLEFQ